MHKNYFYSFRHTDKIRVIILSAALYIALSQISAQELLTLEKAFEIAASYSPDLKQSALSLAQSKENLKAIEASLKSDFRLQLNPIDFSNQLKYDDRPGGNGWYNVQNTTSGGLFSISQPILLTDATLGLNNKFQWQNTNGDKSFYNSLSFTLDQPLFTHNKQKIAYKEVQLEVENAELNYALQKLKMERLITQYFYFVYQKQMQVYINKEELLNQERSHKIIKDKVNAGLAPLEEQYQSNVNYVSSKTSLDKAIVSLEDEKDRFRVLLGQDFEYSFDVLVNVLMDSVPVNVNAAIERSIQVKKEIRQREIDIEIAEFTLLRTKDQNDFQGNLSLQVGLTGQDKSVLNIYEKATNNTGIGISFEVPIWDWGHRKAKLRSAQIGLEKQELLLEDDKVDIILTIRKMHRNLSSLLRQIEQADESVKNAQLTYDINLDRHKNGDITSMDLQLVQNQLSQKKMEQTNAIINYKLELLNMKIQTLYDWETHKELVTDELFEQN